MPTLIDEDSTTQWENICSRKQNWQHTTHPRCHALFHSKSLNLLISFVSFNWIAPTQTSITKRRTLAKSVQLTTTPLTHLDTSFSAWFLISRKRCPVKVPSTRTLFELSKETKLFSKSTIATRFVQFFWNFEGNSCNELVFPVEGKRGSGRKNDHSLPGTKTSCWVLVSYQ